MQISIEDLANILNLQKQKEPLIHCISNLVTMDDLAQSIMCYNGKALITHSSEEVSEITSKSNGLLLDLGSLDGNRVEAMEKSLKIAERYRIPVILDVVGIDRSIFRRNVAIKFLTRYKIDVLKGELSEIKRLGNSRIINEDDKFKRVILKQDTTVRKELRSISKNYKSILVVTGEESYITDGFSEFFVLNGEEIFSKIYSINCILTGLISVGISSTKDRSERFKAILVAVMTFGVAEELALKRKASGEGLATLKKYLLDEICLINEEKIKQISYVIYDFVRE
ncbi:hydroxyethylthiazole kinase [Clostridium sp.]|uniref:hydroxyethylthiazole kinase n=1 Tax=Clostridium sp. TaxID=1506 RepID=UPI003F2A6545